MSKASKYTARGSDGRIGAMFCAFARSQRTNVCRWMLSHSSCVCVKPVFSFHNRRIKRRENILRTDRVRIIIVIIIVIIGSISLNLIQIYSVDERSACSAHTDPFSNGLKTAHSVYEFCSQVVFIVCRFFPHLNCCPLHSIQMFKFMRIRCTSYALTWEWVESVFHAF